MTSRIFPPGYPARRNFYESARDCPGAVNLCLFQRLSTASLSEVPWADMWAWYAIYTCNRHEKKVARRLRSLGLEAYVPLLRVPRLWNDGRKMTIEVPVFPGYAFVRMRPADRIRVLGTRGVVHFVEDVRGPVVISEAQLHIVEKSLQHYVVAPHAYLPAGRIANVVRGPLKGHTGISSPGGMVFTIDGVNLALVVAMPQSEIE